MPSEIDMVAGMSMPVVPITSVPTPADIPVAYFTDSNINATDY